MVRPIVERKARIQAQLDKLVERGVIRSYMLQSCMPGLRWTLEGLGFSTRAYTTQEVEIFILGASEGLIVSDLDRTIVE